MRVSLRSGFLRQAALLGALLMPLPCAGSEGAAIPLPPPPSPAGPSLSERSPGPRWDLPQVISIALENHPLVARADAEARGFEARREQARSPYFPRLDLVSGYFLQRRYASSLSRTVQEESGFARGELSYLLSDFGRTRSAVEQAGALLDASRERGRDVRREIVFEAKVAYLDVLLADRLVSVGRETLRQRESLRNQARAYHEAGIRARIDVARAEANLFQARAGLTEAENFLRVSRITLLNRMGIEGPADFVLEDILAPETVGGTLEDWIREAESRRPDLSELLFRERSAENALAAAKAGHLPVLSGSGSYGYEADEFPLERIYGLSVELSLPVFTGFLVREQVRAAESEVASIRHEVSELRRSLRLEVERSSLAIREALERTAARKAERDASEENLRLATGRYEVGEGDIIEMIDAQVQMARSDVSLLEAQYDYRLALATLERSIGR